LSDTKNIFDVTATLLTAMARFCGNDTVDAERIARYKNALKDFKTVANPDAYNWMAPIFERAIAELEKRLRAKR